MDDTPPIVEIDDIRVAKVVNIGDVRVVASAKAREDGTPMSDAVRKLVADAIYAVMDKATLSATATDETRARFESRWRETAEKYADAALAAQPVAWQPVTREEAERILYAADGPFIHETRVGALAAAIDEIVGKRAARITQPQAEPVGYAAPREVRMLSLGRLSSIRLMGKPTSYCSASLYAAQPTSTDRLLTQADIEVLRICADGTEFAASDYSGMEQGSVYLKAAEALHEMIKRLDPKREE